MSDRPRQAYRIREAVVEVCNGFRCWKDRRFIAERRVSFLGITFWCSLPNARWDTRPDGCENDIRHHIALTQPLSEPIYYTRGGVRIRG